MLVIIRDLSFSYCLLLHDCRYQCTSQIKGSKYAGMFPSAHGVNHHRTKDSYGLQGKCMRGYIFSLSLYIWNVSLSRVEDRCKCLISNINWTFMNQDLDLHILCPNTSYVFFEISPDSIHCTYLIVQKLNGSMHSCIYNFSMITTLSLLLVY